MPPDPVRTCIPDDLRADEWAGVEPYYRELEAREVDSAGAFERWLIDRSELDAACDEARAELYIAASCDTEDAGKAGAYAAFLERTAPHLETAGFRLDRKQVALAERFRLDGPGGRYRVLERAKRARVALFREANVPIQTELDTLSQEFARLAGAQTVLFDGAERTMPRMAAYQLDTDRAVREAAWRAAAERRLADRAALDGLLGRMIERRHRLAVNAGCADFVEYAFRDKLRFDYTPADCERFWAAAERHVVPFMRRRSRERRESLGLSALRPWDLSVDVHGRPGLRPFDGGRQLFERTAAVFDALDGRLAAMFRRLGPAGDGGDGGGGAAEPGAPMVSACLDLDSRKGKRPGGYQYNRARTRRPFIFMNAAGLHRDAMTMLHEAGHAFHSVLCEAEPLLEYRSSPMEFAEVASMSMEHLSMPHWGAPGAYYTVAEDLARARREHLERSVSLLAWIATIDAFQHWMYLRPSHTAAERDRHWLELDARLGEEVDWTGLEEHRAAQWQKQSHLFSHPMYYIEYGIAQLGALQLWLSARRGGERAAVDAYIRALSLGGSRPLPELFEAAGLRFDFGEDTVGRVVEAVEEELALAGSGGSGR